MSDGFAAAQARKEAYLASLILQDVERRGEAVKERGVSAWAHRPKNREQVNERFLRNTLRGVSSNNRRAERSAAGPRTGSPVRSQGAKRGRDTHDGVADRGRGDRSGAHGKGSLEVEEGTSAGSSSSDASSSSERDTRPDDTGKGRGMKDDELAAFLSRPRVKRGRGAVGSRADEPGPFLPRSSSAHSGRHHASSSHTVRGYSLVLPDEATRRDDATIVAMREKAEKKTRKKAEKKERKERKRTRKEGVKAGKASPKKRKR